MWKPYNLEFGMSRAVKKRKAKSKPESKPRHSFSTSDWIGLYGAILASILALVQVGQWIHQSSMVQKERTRVVANMHYLKIRNERDDKIFHMAPVLVSNYGRDTVILKEVAAKGKGWKEGGGWYQEPEIAYGKAIQILPRELKPGESVQLVLFYLAVFRQHKVYEVVVTDTDGHEYRVSDYDLLMMHSEAKKTLGPGPAQEEDPNLGDMHIPHQGPPDRSGQHYIQYSM
jgi:hypothetical protein